MNLLDVLKEKYINDSILLSIEDFCKIYKYPFIVRLEEINNDDLLNSKSPTVMAKNIEDIINNDSDNKPSKIFSIFPIVKTNKNPFPKKITLGRNSLQDIVIQSMSISKFHAYFYSDENNNYFLVDNNSTNGTFINKNKITPNEGYLLNDGDEIIFADLKFIYYLPKSAYEIFRNNKLET